MEATKELIDLLDYLGEKFGLIIDWSQGEILPYIKQLADSIVNYKRQIALMWIIVGIICVIAFIVFEVIAHIQDSDGYCMVGWVCLIAGAIIIVVNCYTVIGCNTFPEKIVLDYIQSVMSTSG